MNITVRARRLRKNMTEAEKRLWRRLRNKQLGTKFRRQEPFGSYVVDFVSFDAKIIIEIDGGQHYDSKTDEPCDLWFKKKGFATLRFWNNDVLKNIEGVLEIIMSNISPSPSPPLMGGEIEQHISIEGRGLSKYTPTKGEENTQVSSHHQGGNNECQSI